MNWGYTILWVVLMVAFLVVEAACPIHLVSIWFAAGSLVAAIAAALGGQLWLQILLFLVISCGLLAALWPFVKKVLNPRRTATNIDAMIGTEGYVTAAVDNFQGFTPQMAGLHQNGHGNTAGVQGPVDDLGAFGDEQAFL